MKTQGPKHLPYWASHSMTVLRHPCWIFTVCHPSWEAVSLSGRDGTLTATCRRHSMFIKLSLLMKIHKPFQEKTGLATVHLLISLEGHFLALVIVDGSSWYQWGHPLSPYNSQYISWQLRLDPKFDLQGNNMLSLLCLWEIALSF